MLVMVCYLRERGIPMSVVLQRYGEMYLLQMSEKYCPLNFQEAELFYKIAAIVLSLCKK